MSFRFDLPKRAIIGRRDGLRWFESVPGGRAALRVDSEHVHGAFTITEIQAPPASGPMLHLHKSREEIFEIMEGEFRFQCAGEMFDASAGMTVVIPRGSEHAWINSGTQPGRLLSILIPGGIDDYFEEIGRTTPEDRPALSEHFDTLIVGPPLELGGGNHRIPKERSDTRLQRLRPPAA